MIDKKADVILNSKYKNIQYYMYSDKIIAKSNDTESYINLPQSNKVIGFYDMYYVKKYIQVIVATRGCYDIRYVLDEDELKLISKQLSK